jgi:RHS repeat-associated protein
MPIGQKIKMYYDPRGNVIRTVNPDASEQWVVHGKPDTLSSISVQNSWSFNLSPFGGVGGGSPTPWESYTYDANDLGDRTHGTFGAISNHWNTPGSSIVDALGRTVKATSRLGQTTNDELVMRNEYDIQGNVLSTIDSLNRIVFRHKYGLAKQLLWKEHIDSGVSTAIADATGKAVELGDAKGAQVLSSYDTISRPENVWAKDKSGEATTLRQHLIYGDSAGLTDPEDQNYLGKLYQHYDDAGLTQINNYDFKGNVTEKFRQVISDAELLSVLGGLTVDCYRVDWTGLDTARLDTQEHQTNSAYDALNRITELIYPEDTGSERKVLLPTYNNAGALEKVVLFDDIGGTPSTYVNHIAYNAKGQRLLIALGNGVMTRYTYDQKTFRLKRQRTETYSESSWTFTSGGSVKQDTAYQYDLVGNILATNESTTNCGVGASNNLLREFDYDSLYRLLSATGRENAPTITPIWDDSYRSTDNSTTTAYTQNYQYDKMGNILELQHIGANNFTRNFNYNTSTNNKLQSIDIGMTNYAFSYDANGNQLTETSNRKFEWDYADRMRSFYVEASGSITKYTQYLYDAGGNRVKKLTWVVGGNYDCSTYIDGIFEYRTDGTDEQNTLHVMDDKSRIATLRIGDDFGDTTPEIKYNLEDHLGSSTIQLETNGATINKEEYYPFGETSFGSYVKKRYKYCGKERDDESGLYYYGARYYNAWTCRFVSVDPKAGKFSHQSPYCYADCNPIVKNDPTGTQTESNAGANTDSQSKSKELNGVSSSSSNCVPNPADGQLAKENNPALKTKMAQDVQKSKKNDNSVNIHVFSTERDEVEAKSFSELKESSSNNIKIIEAKDLKDVIKQVEALKENDPNVEINNVFFHGHGGYEKASFSIGEQRVSNANIATLKQDMQKLGSLLGESANVVITACHAGSYNNGGAELITEVSKSMNRTVYANQSWSWVGNGMYGNENTENGYIQAGFESVARKIYTDRNFAYDQAGKWTKANPNGEYSSINALYYKRDGGFGISTTDWQYKNRENLQVIRESPNIVIYGIKKTGQLISQ